MRPSWDTSPTEKTAFDDLQYHVPDKSARTFLFPAFLHMFASDFWPSITGLRVRCYLRASSDEPIPPMEAIAGGDAGHCSMPIAKLLMSRLLGVTGCPAGPL